MRKKCKRVVRDSHIDVRSVTFMARNVSEDEANVQMLPLLVHIEEVRSGFGFAKSIQIITVYLNAMIMLSKRTRGTSSEYAFNYMREAAEAWIECAEKSHQAGIENRIVMTADAMSKISRAIRVFFVILPMVTVREWVSTAEHCRNVWEKSSINMLAASKSTC